jgi:hypothetical protein
MDLLVLRASGKFCELVGQFGNDIFAVGVQSMFVHKKKHSMVWHAENVVLKILSHPMTQRRC